MKPLILHPKAEAEFDAAIAYYEKQRSGLGLEFHAEIESAFARIQNNPLAFAQINQRGVRRCLIKRFPYSIFFLEFEDYLWVAAVAHQKRRPGYWAKRKP